MNHANSVLEIPLTSTRKVQRFNASTTRNCKARHLMENFYCKLKQYRAIATRLNRRLQTLSPASIWPLQSFGLIEDKL
jgi:hypothetical protein